MPQDQLLYVWRPACPGRSPPVPENQVYGQVEQLPTLPGSLREDVVQAAIQELIRYPEYVVSGDTQVSFVVEPGGRVTQAVLLSSLGTAIDEAILDGVLRLLRFEPGRQCGQAVAVRLRIPVSIEIH